MGDRFASTSWRVFMGLDLADMKAPVTDSQMGSLPGNGFTANGGHAGHRRCDPHRPGALCQPPAAPWGHLGGPPNCNDNGEAGTGSQPATGCNMPATGGLYPPPKAAPTTPTAVAAPVFTDDWSPTYTTWCYEGNRAC